MFLGGPIAENSLTHPPTCTYDAENHLTQFSWAGGSYTYTYDGDGKRVMKSGSPGTIYWYGAGSEALIETDLSNNAQAGYAYFNGQRALRILPNNEVGFYFTDHLGNTRYFQSLAGDNVSDFYPFGGERVYSGGAPTHYKFTGKERDPESGLDNFGARYNSPSMGRFVSPDPLGGHQEDPQTLNKYSYVRDNPLNLTDPSGLDFYLQCGDSLRVGCVQVGKSFKDKQKDGPWVHADKNGNAIIITSDSIRAGDHDAWVNQGGVFVDGSRALYFDNPASTTTDSSGKVVSDHNPIDLTGTGDFKDFSFTINGNCNGSCQASGTFKFGGTPDQARSLLDQRGAFRSPVDFTLPFWGKSLDEWEFHNGTTQHRFEEWSGEPSTHFSVPRNPTNTVPTVGPFHVDRDTPGINHLVCAVAGIGC